MQWEKFFEQETFQQALSHYFEILLLPVNHPELIPTIIPLVIGLIVVAIYYGRYRYEELGWGASVSNSLLMFTIGTTLMYELLPEEEHLAYVQEQLLEIPVLISEWSLQTTAIDPQFFVALTIIGIGAFIVLLDFYHLMPKHLAFFVSSAFTVYTLTYIAIAIVYAEIAVDESAYIAASAVFITSFIIVRTLKMMGKTHKEPKNS